jgi:hypothetical protein
MYKKHDTFNETPIFGRCSYAWHGINPDYRSMSYETIIRILFGFTIFPPVHDTICPAWRVQSRLPSKNVRVILASSRPDFSAFALQKKAFVVLVVGKLRKVIWLSFAELAWSYRKKILLYQ